jgi:hypothetical protein
MDDGGKPARPHKVALGASSGLSCTTLMVQLKVGPGSGCYPAGRSIIEIKGKNTMTDQLAEELAVLQLRFHAHNAVLSIIVHELTETNPTAHLQQMLLRLADRAQAELDLNEEGCRLFAQTVRDLASR